jgi:hypothetical protein
MVIARLIAFSRLAVMVTVRSEALMALDDAASPCDSRRMRTPRALGLALFFATGIAHAEPSSVDQKMGRELFDRGVKAARADDWLGAERYFTQAYAVYPRPTILGSLAGAQAKAGHITQAVASYRRLLQDPGDLSPGEVSAFKAGAAAAEARLAWVRVEIVSPRDGDSVLIDDARVAPESLGAEISTDPGAHAFRLVRDGATTTVNVTLADGEHRKVTLMPALAPTPPPPAPPPVMPEKRGVFSSPWFWTAAGIIVVGGTATVLCVASLCRNDDGYQGSLGSIKLR